MYKHYPSLVLGFHACEREIGEALLSGDGGFKTSTNDYDWLGNGMYFWENSPHRAEKYGEELKNKRKKLDTPFVVGAVIHLGYCFDLLESHSLQVLKNYYLSLKKAYLKSGLEMPINNDVGTNTDKLLRKLDCAVFEYMHSEMNKSKEKPFDSIRAAFWEGEELYPSAGFKEKNHVQICIRNPNCIKGYFRPLEMERDYPIV
ncbi:hypothetical protein PN36_28170 [Candidatus Thiomargarita nelsonii]|uniref:Uncharacterized protein n=1 Tax=Candidatus Thiomargarita nelsonii TaxID=1003181 RepID=A0A0A6PG40_9GAMM|nr:hypothetical protein PN36_28170 [Candidatus Thiomargarita nelsonii]